MFFEQEVHANCFFNSSGRSLFSGCTNIIIKNTVKKKAIPGGEMKQLLSMKLLLVLSLLFTACGSGSSPDRGHPCKMSEDHPCEMDDEDRAEQMDDEDKDKVYDRYDQDQRRADEHQKQDSSSRDG